MQLDEIRERELHVVGGEGAAWIARYLNPLKRREVLVNLLTQILELTLERLDRMNEALGSYDAFFSAIEPVLHEGFSPALFAALNGASPEALLKQVRGVQIIACGTSFYAGSVARYDLFPLLSPTQNTGRFKRTASWLNATRSSAS